MTKMRSKLASCSTPRRSRGMPSENTQPDLTAGLRGLPSNLAFDVALSPSTTWVSPSSRLTNDLDHSRTPGQIRPDRVNHQSVKPGQLQYRPSSPTIDRPR